MNAWLWIKLLCFFLLSLRMLDRWLGVLILLLAVLAVADSARSAGKWATRKNKSPKLNGPFVLERMSQTFIPSHYTPQPHYCLGNGAAEKIAVHSKEHMLYVVGYQMIHVVDIEFPEAPIIQGHIAMSSDITDVVACGDYVAVAEPNSRAVEPGFVHIFGAYRSNSLMPRLHKVQVGPLPDMLKFSSDCKRIFVANEGEPGKDSGYQFTDPEGSFSIINMEDLVEGSSLNEDAVTTINFQAFNAEADTLVDKGVRWAWRNQPGSSASSFSKSLEPEYIALSKDEKKAYVCLQENNAIAVIDLVDHEVEAIIPLGLKDFTAIKSKLDGSDRDDGPNLNNWPIFSTYQPDAIVSIFHRGKEYIVTANEGESTVMDSSHGVEYYSDMTSGAGVASEMSSSTDEDLIDALRDETLLSRVVVSKVDGWSDVEEDGKKVRDRVVIFGGRSFTIFRVEDMEPVFDSGDDLGRLCSDHFPWSFNSAEPEKFCVESPSPIDINDYSRSYFAWLSLPDADRGPRPSHKPFMSSTVVEEMVAEASKKLEEYESTEDPEEYGMQKPSSALTSSPEDAVDATSKFTGMSPEALAVGIVDGRRLLFLSTEKSGVIFVYDITDPMMPVWQSAVYPGQHARTWAELYNDKTTVDVDPEGVLFVSADDSPSGGPLLIVSGSLSGSFSIYNITREPSDRDPELILHSTNSFYKKPEGVLIKSKDPGTTLAVNKDLI